MIFHSKTLGIIVNMNDFSIAFYSKKDDKIHYLTISGNGNVEIISTVGEIIIEEFYSEIEEERKKLKFFPEPTTQMLNCINEMKKM